MKTNLALAMLLPLLLLSCAAVSRAEARFSTEELSRWDDRETRDVIRVTALSAKSLCPSYSDISSEPSPLSPSDIIVLRALQAIRSSPGQLPIHSLHRSDLEQAKVQIEKTIQEIEGRQHELAAFLPRKGNSPDGILKTVEDAASTSLRNSRKYIFTVHLRNKLLSLFPSAFARTRFQHLNSTDDQEDIRMFAAASDVLRKINSVGSMSFESVLKAEIRRLQLSRNYEITRLHINQQFLNKKIPMDKPAPLPPFSDMDLIRAYRAYLAHETLVGKGMPSCGLTFGERAALLEYGREAYQKVNAQLWQNQTTPEVKVIVEALRSGLAKLSPFIGWVHRDAQLPEAEIAKHVKGAEREYLAFTSTSLRKGFNNSRSVHLLIHSKRGRLVVPFVQNQQLWEVEVLFLPGSRFRVLDKNVGPDGRTNIIMEEIAI